MKIAATAGLLVLLFIGCSKENSNYKEVITAEENSTAIKDPVNIPIDVIGAGVFRESIGGLYPGGSNVPTGVYAEDLLTTSRNIIPLDTLGNPAKTSKLAKITFISLGGSTGGHNMKALKNKTVGNPLTNPRLQLLSCNNGSGNASINDILNPNSVYWAHVTQIIKGGKSSYRQVQVIYLETEDSTSSVTWPARPTRVKDEIATCLRVLKQKFPNVKVVYTLGRTRTFTSSAMWNREPSPYYFGWAAKWAIEDQINGVAGTEYKGESAVAPMLTWGFYQWADSLPRSTDGFYWRKSLTSDGLHANEIGQDTLSNRFQQFLLNDPYASIWYAKH